MDFREALAMEMQKSKAKLVESRTRKVESKIEEDTEEYLEPRFDSRASFYKKAKVVTKDNGDEELYSYGTHVGGMRNGKPYSKGTWSQTTSRHQKEYFKQKGFDPKEVELEEGKKLEEDKYSDEIFSRIEEALENAGFEVERFTDAGVLTKNLGWVLDGNYHLTVDGSWLDDESEELDEGKECNKGDKEKKEELLDISPDVNIDISDSTVASGNDISNNLEIPLSLPLPV